MAINWAVTANKLLGYTTDGSPKAQVALPLLTALNSAGAAYSAAGNDSASNASIYGQSVATWWNGTPATASLPASSGASAAWAYLDQMSRYVYSLGLRNEQASAASAFGVTGAVSPSLTLRMAGTPNLAFVAAGSTVTRSGGSWLVDNFAVGDFVDILGSTSNNVASKEITALTTTAMSFASGLTNEGPIGGVSVAGSSGLKPLTYGAPTPLAPDVTMQIQATLNGRVTAAQAMGSVPANVQALLAAASAVWTASLAARPAPNVGLDFASTSAINALQVAIAAAQAWLATASFV